MSLFFVMQTTAHLWETLCSDFESRKQSSPPEDYVRVARDFAEGAHRMLRADSPRLIDAIEIAGDVCQSCGELVDARAFFEEALTLARRADSRPSAARISAKLAMLADSLNDLVTARDLYKSAMEAFEQAGDRSMLSPLLNGYASVCRRLGDSVEAERAYSRAMEMAARIHGETHPEVAIAANNLGVAYTDAGDLVQAENLHMQALAIREKCFGGMHPDVAQSLGNLAVVYHTSRDFDRAENFYRASLDIYRRFRPDDDPEVAAIRANAEILAGQRANQTGK
ncbi:MAG: hypothetical protein Fur0032_21840 [Terrimicrobiaceae bacterium]